MKLRNKQTGEIKEWDFGNWYQTILNPGNKEKYECNLNDFINRAVKFREEWEDYEEPKGIQCIYCVDHFDAAKIDGVIIGFNTKEEAKQALEKLKAWKRLKDKGFRFDVVPALGHCDDEKFDISIIATMPAKWWYNDKVVDDIHYVFGGEE